MCKISIIRIWMAVFVQPKVVTDLKTACLCSKHSVESMEKLKIRA